MTFHVEFSESARRVIRKMDKFTQKMIINWVEKNLEGCEDPRLHGKPLSGDKSGQWRYRIGDYRIISLIEDDRLIILVLAVGHRRDIYN